jgi:hypothetical protein
MNLDQNKENITINTAPEGEGNNSLSKISSVVEKVRENASFGNGGQQDDSQASIPKSNFWGSIARLLGEKTENKKLKIDIPASEKEQRNYIKKSIEHQISFLESRIDIFFIESSRKLEKVINKIRELKSIVRRLLKITGEQLRQLYMTYVHRYS